MRQACNFLLQISSLFTPIQFKPLHDTKSTIKAFEEIKIKYREVINELYKHFLTEAMKRYNIKNEGISITERMRLKQQGL
jgi:hypothetical protein